ncbi:uncharacterized protein LOC112503989 isoform X3 [Cynara cardunculus var. scolymus]|uniref:uncharacterized protein LOC112503989 isoform X3 n=1 Tax=Cynara cardunculus var. scolymus TaxID=59895 RepID=UPI000D63124F|nr:uncharacterized protein LOC112503989 isoform X3 [Cynara cardunculus var. scolymus]XP_024963725.1 uncharacterized protein LOC112503989 isoform X3 [Cynara cardunculus var. scolymus]
MPNIFLLLYVHPIMNSGAGSKFSLNSSSQDGRSSSPYDDSTSVGALFEGTVSLQIPYFSLSLAKRDASTENSEQWQRIRCGSFGCFLLLLIQVDEWCSFSGSSGTQTSLQSTWIRGIFLV